MVTSFDALHERKFGGKAPIFGNMSELDIVMQI